MMHHEAVENPFTRLILSNERKKTALLSHGSGDGDAGNSAGDESVLLSATRTREVGGGEGGGEISDMFIFQCSRKTDLTEKYREKASAWIETKLLYLT